MTIPRFLARLFSLPPRKAVEHPWIALSAITLLTLCAVPGIRHLKLQTDGRCLLSPTAPEIVYDRNVRNEFDIKDNVVVLIRSDHPDGIFNPDTLQLVRDVTAAMMQIPGVDTNVMSLATEPGLRFRPGTWTIQKLLEPALKTPAELDQLKDDLRRIQLYTGTLVSTNGKLTVVLVGVPDNKERPAICENVVKVAGRFQHVSVTGVPVAEALLGVHVLDDLGVPRQFLGAAAGSLGASQPDSIREVRFALVRRLGLIPIVAVVMTIAFLVFFRNLFAALLPMPGAVASMLFVFGTMGWLGVPIYLTTAALPVLITVLSVTNDIYFFTRYFHLLRDHPERNHVEAVIETFDKLSAPVACTSLTASIGFLSFAVSPLAPVRAFGVFTAVGSLFGLIVSLTVLPALLVLINPQRLVNKSKRRDSDGKPSLIRWLSAAGTGDPWRRSWVTGIILAAIAVAALGVSRLTVQDSWMDGFDPHSEFRTVTRELNENLLGVHQLLVVLEAPQTIYGTVPASAFSPGTISFPLEFAQNRALVDGSPITLSVSQKLKTDSGSTSPGETLWQSQIEMPGIVGSNFVIRLQTGTMAPNFLEELNKAHEASYSIAARSHVRPEIVRDCADLAAFIRQRSSYQVGGVIGPADYLATTALIASHGDPNARVVPSDADHMGMLWDFYGDARGQHGLHQAVSSNFWGSVTTVFLKDANFADTARLMADIRSYEREHLASRGISLGFAGNVAVSQTLIRNIVTTQVQSLAWSLAGIFLVTTLFGGSMRSGIYCLLPSALAVLVKFGIMGWMRIPLGVATSMFAAMTLGIGVNCAIHLLESYRHARESGQPTDVALRDAMQLTALPAVINTVAMSLGFGVLILSQVPANARLGLLVVLGLVNCLIISLLILPELLAFRPSTRTEKEPSLAIS